MPDYELPITTTPIRSETDVDMYVALDVATFGDASIGEARIREILAAYPEAALLATVGDRVIGALVCYPLTDEFAAAFEAGRVRENDLSPDAIAPPGACRTWYISALEVEPAFRRNGAVKALLAASLSSFPNRLDLGYPLRLLALAYSPAGRALLEKFGFIVARRAEEMPDGCPLYELTLETQGDWIAVIRQASGRTA